MRSIDSPRASKRAATVDMKPTGCHDGGRRIVKSASASRETIAFGPRGMRAPRMRVPATSGSAVQPSRIGTDAARAGSIVRGCSTFAPSAPSISASA